MESCAMRVPGRSGRAVLRLAILLLLTAPSPADTLVVDPHGGADFTDLQSAVDAARPGDTVLARSGEYLVCAPLTFRGKAITVRSEGGPDRTVIRRCLSPVDAVPLSTLVFQDGEGAGSVLDGFTVAGELKDMAEFSIPHDLSGGGILCAGGASPLIRNCVVAGHAASFGGGIACLDGSSPRISGCKIAWNVALGGGGVFLRNSSPLIEDCTILGNMAAPADTGGSGILCLGGSPVFSRCRIAGNGATCGSAFHADGASALLESCTIFGNSFAALEVGGGDGAPIFVNCTISGNEVDGSVCHGNLPSLFLNCIVWTRGSRPLWTGDPLNLTEADPRFVDEGVFDPRRWTSIAVGGNEIRVLDPVVEDPDFHLLPDSPAIDAGATLAAAPPADFDGTPRPCRGGVDLGAFEYVGQPERDENSNDIPDECEEGFQIPGELPGDCNQDDAFDISDPICLLGHLFRGEPASLPCGEGTLLDRGNVELLDHNGDSGVDLADGIAPLLRLFSGGAPHVLGEACVAIRGCQDNVDGCGP
jgi:hypothetical protein